MSIHFRKFYRHDQGTRMRACCSSECILTRSFMRAITSKARRLPIRGGPGSNLGLVMWDFVIDKSGAGAGFLRELRFISPANVHSICFSTIILTITRGWHNRPGVAAVPIVSQTRIKKNKNNRKPLGIGHVYIYNFFRTLTDTVTSQNIDLYFWNIQYARTDHV
jgi:hypothetical protein